MLIKSPALFAIVIASVSFALLATLLVSTSSSVRAMYKVPDLARDQRCPACISFALAMRRASWEAHPEHSTKNRVDRKKHLNKDSRCQDIITEAMDIILTRQTFVYYAPEDSQFPQTWRTSGVSDEKTLEMVDENEDHNNIIMLHTNKSDAPDNAIGRFWSLQDLYQHRRLQVSEFQKIMAKLSKNTDESLMHFLHDELRENLGEESEGLCYLDLFHSKNYTRDEYVNEPVGLMKLDSFSSVGKAFDLHATWLTLNILKNRTLDELEALPWPYKLCKGKDLCGKDAEKAPGFGKKKVKEYILSMYPIHPPKMAPKDFSDDPEKASGEFFPDPKIAEAAMMREREEAAGNHYEPAAETDRPLMNEEY